MESPRKVFPFRGLNGAQGRNRTTDTAIFSRMLYQLSYLGFGTGLPEGYPGLGKRRL